MKFNVLIYRPDKLQANINPDLCFTANGQSYAEWKRDEQTVYDYRVKLIKEKISDIPEHKVFDWWR